MTTNISTNSDGVRCAACLTECQVVDTWTQTINGVSRLMVVYECENCGHGEVHPLLDS